MDDDRSGRAGMNDVWGGGSGVVDYSRRNELITIMCIFTTLGSMFLNMFLIPAVHPLLMFSSQVPPSSYDFMLESL